MSLIHGIGGSSDVVDFRALMLERLTPKKANFEEVLGSCLEQQTSPSDVNSTAQNMKLNEDSAPRYNAQLGLYQLPDYMVKAKRGTSTIERSV